MRLSCAALAVMVIVACSAGCNERNPAPPAPTSTPASTAAPSTIAVHTYTVRAMVTLLPSKENPAASFTVRHEPLPQFMGEQGKLGMPAMEMPFPLKDGADISTVHLGQKIELTFEVDYDTEARRPTGYRATRFTPLPDDTRLNFGS